MAIRQQRGLVEAFPRGQTHTTPNSGGAGSFRCLNSAELSSLIEEIIDLAGNGSTLQEGKRLRLQAEIDNIPPDLRAAFRLAFSGESDGKLLELLGLTLPVITVPETSTASCPVVQMR